MVKLDLEAVVEDASEEVLQFEIQISLINPKFVLIVQYTTHYQIIDFLSQSLAKEDYLKESHHAQLVFECQH